MRARSTSVRSGAALLALATAVACSGGESLSTASPPDVDAGTDASPRPAPTSTTVSADAAVSEARGDASSDASSDATAPGPTDGIKNLGETDVDCGGPSAATPRCALYKTCLAATDCAGGAKCIADGAGVARCQNARSCTGASGTQGCGLDGATEDCCIALPVPGGSFLRQNDPAQPTTVSSFRLDKYEITVGRVRKYFEAVGGNPKANAPAPGAATHPKNAGSGWRSSFDVRLPASWQEINDRLGAVGCAVGGDNNDGGAASWTPTPGPYEDLPITCLDWYTMFAFCAWDGARLPTDAEWDYAASGGDEQRTYSWGNGPQTLPFTPEVIARVATTIHDTDGTFKSTVGSPFRAIDPVTGRVNDGPLHMTPPGRKTGRGRWGHADLNGNVLEYLLDVGPIPAAPCVDCARVDFPDPPQDQVGFYPPAWRIGEGITDAENPDGRRSLRGGSWDIHELFTAFRYDYRLWASYYAAGGRCARD